MREQRGLTANTFKRRTSLPPEEREYSASRYHVGTRAGMHPEDNPYITYGKPLGRTYVTTRSGLPAEYNEEDDDDETRTHSTVVVRHRPYTQVETVRVRETDDLEDSQPRRHLHPLVYVGVGLLFLSLFITAYTYIPQAWQRHLDDMQYGYPRTYQTDANVGHGGVSHFIVLNKQGTIEVVELPPDPTKNTPRLYLITSFANDGADLIPATVSFHDITGNGRLDMIVTVYNGTNPTIYQLYNDGTKFKPHV
jgi:hypothetical protein